MKNTSLLGAFVAGILLAQPALAQNVKVTPLGGQEGEFCPLDRALIFEDPNGTRVLYDPGRTVAGADDPRLGKIDVVLVSHMHGDHVGDLHAKAPNSGACDKPDFSVSAKPNSSAPAATRRTPSSPASAPRRRSAAWPSPPSPRSTAMRSIPS